MSMSIADYFTQLESYSQEMNSPSQSQSRKYLTLTSKQSSGSTFMFRLIPDSNGMPVRLIHNVHDVWITTPSVNDDGTPVKNQDGTQAYYNMRNTVCGLSNYTKIELSNEDKLLIKNTEEIIKKYSDLVYNEVIDPDEYGISITTRPEVSIWWGKMLNCSNKDLIDSVGSVYLMRSHSKTFFQDWCKALHDKTTMKGSADWMNKYISRDVGKHDELCSIGVTLDVGYKFRIQFDSGAVYEVTQDDINSATDLNMEYINITSFDRDRYQHVYNTIKEALDKYSNLAASNIGLVPAPEVTPVNANVAYSAHSEVNTESVKPVQQSAPNNTMPPYIPPFGPPTSL